MLLAQRQLHSHISSSGPRSHVGLYHGTDDIVTEVIPLPKLLLHGFDIGGGLRLAIRPNTEEGNAYAVDVIAGVGVPHDAEG
jgi:hypothetical protein